MSRNYSVPIYRRLVAGLAVIAMNFSFEIRIDQLRRSSSRQG